MKGKARIVFDAGLNVLAVFLPTFILQFVIFPASVSRMDDNTFGLMTTIFALMNLIPGTFGLALCNVRLIYNSRCMKEGGEGNFGPVSSCLLFLTVISIVVACCFYGGLAIEGIVLVALTAAGWFYREYLVVAFRIEIDYCAILVSNLFLSAGYGVGFLVFRITGVWESVLLFGQVFSLLYVARKTDIWRRGGKSTTPLFSSIAKDVTHFSAAAFLSRGISYSDRVLLYPLLGGYYVGVYYVSTLIGKMVSMFASPLGTVLLTYLAKRDQKPTSAFLITLLAGLVCCGIGMAVVVAIAGPLLQFLYPDLWTEAMVYVPWASAAALVYALASVLNSYLVRFYSMAWQTKINAVIFVFYIACSLICFKLGGLMGFCVAYLVINVLRLAAITAIFFRRDMDTGSIG